ncbi:MAG: SMC family ATPase [Candidatus Thermoplasmatota archaeon]|nr:SMC family ATPase [Candidatus Thermoplasmatota archaeon]
MKTLESFTDDTTEKSKTFPSIPGKSKDFPEEKTGESKKSSGSLEKTSTSSTDAGFIIDSVEMKKFVRYTDKTTIVFPEKFTVIVGKTGSGKTTILDAITFALYKSTSRTDLPGVKIEDVCKNEGYVKICFHQGNNKYKVKRGLTNNGKSYVTLKMNDETIPGSIPETDEKIKNIVGLDYTGFRNSTFVRQEEMKQLGSETGSERLEIFQKLFRLETFEKAQNTSSEKLRSLQLEIKGVESELAVKNEMVAKLPEKTKILNEKNKQIMEEKRKLKDLVNVLDEKQKEQVELSKKHDEYLKTKARIESKEETLGEIEKKIGEADEKEKAVKSLKEEIEKLEKETTDYESLRNEGESLREKMQNAIHMEREKTLFVEQKNRAETEYKKSMGELLERLQMLEDRAKNLTTDIDKDKAFSLLRTEGGLKERINRIEKEMGWKLEEKIKQEIIREKNDAEKEIENVSMNVKKINADSFLKSEIEAQVKIIKNDLERNEKDSKEKIAEIDNLIKQKQKSIDETGFGEKQKKRLSELRILISRKQEMKEKLDLKRKEFQEIGDVTSLIENLKKQKKENEDDLKEKEIHLKETESFETRYQKIEEEIKTIGEKRNQEDRIVVSLERDIENLKNEITELGSIKKEIKEAEKKCNELRKTSEITTILKENIFHKKGIVMYAINKLLPHLETEASKNLSELTDSRFNNVKIETYEENKKYGVKINVVGPDNTWHDVQEFSGGERTQINAALRFAIAKELSSLPQVGKTYGRMKTLFIDEGDLGSLDTEVSMELFVKKLFDMGKFFEKIILITHLTEVSERFPNRIQINMSANGESRVEVMG